MAKAKYDEIAVLCKRSPSREPEARHAEYERAKARNPLFFTQKNKRERERWRRKNPLKPENPIGTIFYKGPLISRKMAVKAGKKKYFTGRACRFGHVDEWAVSGGCIHCRRIKLSKKESGKSLEWLNEDSIRPRPTVCDICRKKADRIILDHCHERGNFRGWLCDKCNFCLGLANDNPNLLRKMAKYLDRANGKVNGGAEKETTNIGIFGSRPFLPY